MISVKDYLVLFNFIHHQNSMIYTCILIQIHLILIDLLKFQINYGDHIVILQLVVFHKDVSILYKIL